MDHCMTSGDRKHEYCVHPKNTQATCKYVCVCVICVCSGCLKQAEPLKRINLSLLTHTVTQSYCPLLVIQCHCNSASPLSAAVSSPPWPHGLRRLVSRSGLFKPPTGRPNPSVSILATRLPPVVCVRSNWVRQ